MMTVQAYIDAFGLGEDASSAAQCTAWSGWEAFIVFAPMIVGAILIAYSIGVYEGSK